MPERSETSLDMKAEVAKYDRAKVYYIRQSAR